MKRSGPVDDMAKEGRFGRRAFLGAVAAMPLVGRELRAGSDEGAPKGMIVRESAPKNLESPFSALDEFLTPTDKFYVRNHFAIPSVTANTWNIAVEGHVDHPFTIGVDDLKKLPTKTVTAMLECAGNGRVLLAPKAKGVAWENGAVSNAEWTGVPLRTLLDRAGVREGAVEIIFEGADKGRIEDEPKSPGEIHFARSIPLKKGLDDVLLAFEMNGKDLTLPHGFPVRALVPGWYGMASIKWLNRVIVTDRPFAGYFQTLDYSIFERCNGVPTMVPLTENAVKSQIARPTREETVPKGVEYRVFGAAWAGENAVVKVEISTDEGKSWSEARLLGDSIRHSWRRWEWPWKTPQAAGRASLMTRATDDRGRTQPMQRDLDLRTVMIHHVVPVEVEVR